jgi:hypothetical protein
MEDESTFVNKTLNCAYFQFDEDEPILFAIAVDNELNLRLIAEETSNPTMTFHNGKGKKFSIFLKNELQSEIP